MKALRFLLLIVHIAITVLLFGTVLNAYVSPKTFPYLNFLSLAFPVLIIFYLIITLIWIVLRKKRAFLFIGLLLLLLNPIKRWVNFTSKNDKKNTLKVMTFNVHNNNEFQPEKISSFLQQQDCDVILVQEATYDGRTIPKSGLPFEASEYLTVGVYSKYKVLNYGKIINSEEKKRANAMFADIDVNGKTIRFINVYLDPFSLDKSKVDVENELSGNKQNVKYLYTKLTPIFKKHQNSIDQIKPYIDQSPYPVILAGDFNAVPNSYEYYQLSENLTDAFSSSGRGFGTSFHDLKFPIRIDYIFSSKSIKPVSYNVDRTTAISDHYPVIAEFKLD